MDVALAGGLLVLALVDSTSIAPWPSPCGWPSPASSSPTTPPPGSGGPSCSAAHEMVWVRLVQPAASMVASMARMSS